MFDIGFSEVLLIFVIALVVLGPEKLPRLASQAGRWIGRARAMARQFREQLEEEVNLDNVRKAHEKTRAESAAQAETTSQTGTADAQASDGMAGATGADATGATADAGDASTGTATEETTPAQFGQHGSMISPDPVDFRADTFSHAHATDEYGANPYTANGAAAPQAEPPPAVASAPQPVSAGAAPAYTQSIADLPDPPEASDWSQPSPSASRSDAQTPSEANVAAAQPKPGEAYAPTTTTDSDKHGHA